MYYEMKQSESMTQEAANKFKQILPELCGEVRTADKKYIIFGAGKYGERAATSLGGRAAFFTDSDPAKVGMIKCGLKILGFQEAVGYAANYCFLIAVATERIYEMILQLQEAGIKEYGVF